MRRGVLVFAASVLLGSCGGGSETHTAASAKPRVETFANATPYPKPVPRHHASKSSHTSRPAAALAPRIVQRPIPFPARRKTEMAAYARRHYGLGTYRLRSPHVIVEHYTATATFSQAYNTFAPDVPDSELHELPGTCAHFVIDRGGTIYQLVPLSLMCRHTVGLNWTAVGIEHVGMSDAGVMGDAAQLRASLRLTRWLRCGLGISVKNVIGHNESLSSPYHHERVAALRTQTHGDMRHSTMTRYRRMLSRLGC